jgi:transcriptional regulator with XRE-family HTH domain
MAARVRMAMAAQQRSVTELAAALGLDRGVTLERHRGEKSFTLTEIEAIADWLGLEVDVLLTADVATLLRDEAVAS